MINFKSAALAAVLAIGLGGAAWAQVTSGTAAGGQRAVPPGGMMQNGAPLSNGQTVEPGRRMNRVGRSGMRQRSMMRGRTAMRHGSMKSRRMMRRPM